MKPTVGQMVIYTDNQNPQGMHQAPAVVTAVHQDGSVGLHVMGYGVPVRDLHSVQFSEQPEHGKASPVANAAQQVAGVGAPGQANAGQPASTGTNTAAGQAGQQVPPQTVQRSS